MTANVLDPSRLMALCRRLGELLACKQKYLDAMVQAERSALTIEREADQVQASLAELLGFANGALTAPTVIAGGDMKLAHNICPKCGGSITVDPIGRTWWCRACDSGQKPSYAPNANQTEKPSARKIAPGRPDDLASAPPEPDLGPLFANLLPEPKKRGRPKKDRASAVVAQMSGEAVGGQAGVLDYQVGDQSGQANLPPGLPSDIGPSWKLAGLGDCFPASILSHCASAYIHDVGTVFFRAARHPAAELSGRLRAVLTPIGLSPGTNQDIEQAVAVMLECDRIFKAREEAAR